jgi:ribosome-binding protein aMBF1 (putative translation factor)
MIDLDKLVAKSSSVDDVVQRNLESDSEFRAYWERTAFAREVAMSLIRYRREHGLEIDQLAAQLGLDAEIAGSLEEGEEDLDVSTLRLLSERLGLSFLLDIHPAKPGGVEVIYSVA